MKKQKIFKMGLIALLVFVVALIAFGSAIVIFFVVDYRKGGIVDYSSEEYFDLIKSVTAQAIEKEDFVICNQLKINASYKEPGPYTLYDNGVYTGQPRINCFRNYYIKKLDIDTCDEIAKFDNTGRCFSYMAEVYSDLSFCDKLVGDSGEDFGARCRAISSLDYKYCYDMRRDEHDVSKYYRGVGFCIGDVVLRTKEEKHCLEIDGPDYGEQWDLQRNKCLWYAMLDEVEEGGHTALTRPVVWYCDDMVDDDVIYDPPFHSYKQKCIDRDDTVVGIISPLPRVK